MVKQNRALTLIEMITVLAIMGFILTMAISLLKRIPETQKINSLLNIQQEAKSVLHLMTKEIREAQFMMSTDITPAQIIFVTLEGSSITYRVDGGQLSREVRDQAGVVQNYQVLLKNVKQPTTYSLFTGVGDKTIVINLYFKGPMISGQENSAHFGARVTNRNGGIRT